MVLRSIEEYKQSLRDGRVIYLDGELVKDVTQHRTLSVTTNHSASIFEHQQNSKLRELFTYKSPETGSIVSRYFQVPRSAQDLLIRNALIEESTRRCRSTLNIVKTVGTDALFALRVVAYVMDKDLGTEYSSRVEKYHVHCQEEDLTMALAQTDVKGDRKLKPHEQTDPDLYVRIIAQNERGVIVRGAKAHTTAAPVVNELIVIPTRSMTERDADYAVAFAIPVATRGVKMIVRPTITDDKSEFDYPVSRRDIETESLTIFDDVFVPRERVFMAGEWKYAGLLATTFANYHRFTAISYKPPIGDLFTGAAQLVAEYNGLEDASHIQEKIARLIQYTEMVRACAKIAATEAVKHTSGLVMPNAVYANLGKHHFASQFHEACRIIQDIAGGLVMTSPSKKDLKNPASSQYIRKYLAGAKGVPTEQRLKLFNLIRDLTATEFGGYNLVVSLHGEGSLEAQLITTYRDYDIARCKRLVNEIIKAN